MKLIHLIYPPIETYMNSIVHKHSHHDSKKYMIILLQPYFLAIALVSLEIFYISDADVSFVKR